MAVIGLRFDSLEGRRTKLPRGEIKVNSSPKIEKVAEVEMNALGKKALAITFQFVTTYGDDVAEIRIGGDLLYLAEDNQKVLKKWEKDKKLPDAMQIDVLNHLFRRCLTKVIALADDLQLPPPVGFPLVKTKKDVEPSYVG